MCADKRNFYRWKAPREAQVVKAFQQFDLDNSGSIDKDEIQQALSKYWGIDLSPQELNSIMQVRMRVGRSILCSDRKHMKHRKQRH